MRLERPRSGEGANERRQPSSLDAERQSFGSRIRLTCFGLALRALRLASQVGGHGQEDLTKQNREILDRLDALLSRLPATLRDLLTGSKDAEELFVLLEGKNTGDVAGIGEAVETLRKREQVRTSRQEAGRNDPCPCQSGRKFKKCCGRSRQD